MKIKPGDNGLFRDILTMKCVCVRACVCVLLCMYVRACACVCLFLGIGLLVQLGRKFSRGFYFRETLHVYAKFREKKSSRNGEIALTIIDTGKSYITAKFFDRKFVF